MIHPDYYLENILKKSKVEEGRTDRQVLVAGVQGRGRWCLRTGLGASAVRRAWVLHITWERFFFNNVNNDTNNKKYNKLLTENVEVLPGMKISYNKFLKWVLIFCNILPRRSVSKFIKY